MLGLLVLMLNVLGAAAYLMAALAWLRVGAASTAGGPLGAPEERLAVQSRLMARGAIWAAVGVACDALSILAVFLIAMAG